MKYTIISVLFSILIVSAAADDEGETKCLSKGQTDLLTSCTRFSDHECKTKIDEDVPEQKSYSSIDMSYINKVVQPYLDLNCTN